MNANAVHREFLPPGAHGGERAATRAALIALQRRHLAPYEPDEIATAANSNQRSAREWKDGRALASSASMSQLRAWLPALDAQLRELEAIDAQLIMDLRLQYGPQARLADGD